MNFLIFLQWDFLWRVFSSDFNKLCLNGDRINYWVGLCFLITCIMGRPSRPQCLNNFPPIPEYESPFLLQYSCFPSPLLFLSALFLCDFVHAPKCKQLCSHSKEVICTWRLLLQKLFNISDCSLFFLQLLENSMSDESIIKIQNQLAYILFLFVLLCFFSWSVKCKKRTNFGKVNLQQFC